MKIAVVGKGGREHAFVDAFAPHGHDVYALPGNPGIPNSVDADPFEFDADLFVIGSENDLVNGQADQLRAQGKVVLGPGADGAQLEGSKAWMKKLLLVADVPSARFFICRTEYEIREAVVYFQGRCAVKTDYLMGGKGVAVFLDDEDGAYNDAVSKTIGGKTVVIEELLDGWEFSFFALCDGIKAVPFGTAQDYKRLLDDDQGPNTGGMGAYSPVAAATPELQEWMMTHVINPTLAAMAAQDIRYRGFLYAGMMMTSDGPKVLEFNIRFGDPEAQVVLPRLDPACDLAEVLRQAASGMLADGPVFTTQAAVTVVLAAENYGLEGVDVRTGDPIMGTSNAVSRGARVYYAGVATNSRGGGITSGGRVLAATGLGGTVEEARSLAYAAAGDISWDGMQYRTDIAANPH